MSARSEQYCPTPARRGQRFFFDPGSHFQFILSGRTAGGKLCRAVLLTPSTHTYTLHVYL